jgi:signal transduction histidine kinase
VIIRANDAAAEILGFPTNLIEGASILSAPWNRIVTGHGEMHEGSTLDNPIAAILDGKVESARFSLEMTAGGSECVFSVAASAIRHDGQREGLVAVFRDTTSERDVERKKEEFLRHLSHELRGPLTVIGAASQMMVRNLSRREMTHEAHHAQLIREHAARMAGMVEDLVESSRLESGEQALSEEPTDPGELVRCVLRRIKIERQPSMAAHSIRVTVQPNLPMVSLDKRRIDQVLTNLLTNAMKYSPGGTEIKVTAGTEGEPPRWLRIAVIDSGAGVPDEEKERIFDQEYRGAAGKAMSQTGLGLGLYISKLAVEAHGGQIGVEDTPGGTGSTFWFSLPVTRD